MPLAPDLLQYWARILPKLPPEFSVLREHFINVRSTVPSPYLFQTYYNLLCEADSLSDKLALIGLETSQPLLEGKYAYFLSYCHQPSEINLSNLIKALNLLNIELSAFEIPKNTTNDPLLEIAKNVRVNLHSNDNNLMDTTNSTDATYQVFGPIKQTTPAKKRTNIEASPNTDQDSSFKFPAKFAKIKENPTVTAISTENSFSPIENTDDDITDKPDAVTPPAPPPKPPKPEPITIKMTTNWRDLIKAINGITNSDTPRKFVNNAIKIFPSTIDQYREIQNYLDHAGAEYHCIQLRSERPRKVLIKGLPVDTTMEEIRSALLPYNFEIRRISQLKSFKNKKPLPIFMINILPTNKFERIYDISTFLGFQVNIEAYKLKSVKQCYNCQLFNHASDNCRYSPVCVKCAGPHKSSDCKISSKTDLKCANCEGNHTANYGGCPQNPKNKKLSTIGNPPNNAKPSTNIPPTPKIRPNTINQPSNDKKPLPTFNKNYDQNFPPLPNSEPSPHGFSKLSHPDLFNNLDEIILKIEKLVSLLNQLKLLTTELGLPLNIDSIKSAFNINLNQLPHDGCQ